MNIIINGKEYYIGLDLNIDFLMIYATIGKKKKAFLKFLRSLGYKRDILNAYENYIKEGKGARLYSWVSFQYYIFTNYCSCERSQ